MAVRDLAASCNGTWRHVERKTPDLPPGARNVTDDAAIFMG
jgi:hypothetical protein